MVSVGLKNTKVLPDVALMSCSSDAGRGLGVHALAFFKGLFDRDALNGHCSAVNPSQEVSEFEYGEVAPEGFRSDVQLLGEGGDVHPRVIARLGRDRCLTFRCVHAPLPYSAPNSEMAPADVGGFTVVQPGPSPSIVSVRPALLDSVCFGVQWAASDLIVQFHDSPTRRPCVVVRSRPPPRAPPAPLHRPPASCPTAW